MNAIMTIVVVSVLLFGCDGNEFKTSTDGYEFKYIKKGTGDLPKNGEIVVYNMKYIDEKDSLIFETDADQPAVEQYGPFIQSIQNYQRR
jgi:hypothetical protein